MFDRRKRCKKQFFIRFIATEAQFLELREVLDDVINIELKISQVQVWVTLEEIEETLLKHD